MELISTYLSEIVAAIIGAIGGAAVSVPITIRVQNRKSSGESTQSDQKNARAGGDIVGRDKTTNHYTDNGDKDDEQR